MQRRLSASDILRQNGYLRARKLTKEEIDASYKEVKAAVLKEHSEAKMYDKYDWRQMLKPMDF